MALLLVKSESQALQVSLVASSLDGAQTSRPDNLVPRLQHVEPGNLFNSLGLWVVTNTTCNYFIHLAALLMSQGMKSVVWDIGEAETPEGQQEGRDFTAFLQRFPGTATGQLCNATNWKYGTVLKKTWGIVPGVKYYDTCLGASDSGIVEGTVSKMHSRPYMVSLQLGKRHECGGALVRKDFVLTSAHCNKLA
ncbi:hypothetical protein NHX12_007223 [Muraenolepis orangiensis]|uniref:Peptidase S1 domain-containing protein n=1 Tax=Muraenolepis orangiensis TaxID=630683 RepID=A0A9Q0DPF9_9TELE|nr:hypothetical protein NHX12_007223 [Muraenolepis orangiensis]